MTNRDDKPIQQVLPGFESNEKKSKHQQKESNPTNLLNSLTKNPETKDKSKVDNTYFRKPFYRWYNSFFYKNEKPFAKSTVELIQQKLLDKQVPEYVFNLDKIISPDFEIPDESYTRKKSYTKNEYDNIIREYLLSTLNNKISKKSIINDLKRQENNPGFIYSLAVINEFIDTIGEERLAVWAKYSSKINEIVAYCTGRIEVLLDHDEINTLRKQKATNSHDEKMPYNVKSIHSKIVTLEKLHLINQELKKCNYLSGFREDLSRDGYVIISFNVNKKTTIFSNTLYNGFHSLIIVDDVKFDLQKTQLLRRKLQSLYDIGYSMYLKDERNKYNKRYRYNAHLCVPGDKYPYQYDNIVTRPGDLSPIVKRLSINNLQQELHENIIKKITSDIKSI